MFAFKNPLVVVNFKKLIRFVMKFLKIVNSFYSRVRVYCKLAKLAKLLKLAKVILITFDGTSSNSTHVKLKNVNETVHVSDYKIAANKV